MPTTSKNPLDVLVSEAYERWGIVVDPRKKQMVTGRLQKAATRLGVAGLKQLVEALQQDKSGKVDTVLFDVLSTNFTSFFREREHIDFLVEQARKEGRGGLRYWSAGCSNGSEPYSLSIALSDGLGGSAAHGVKILASDLAVSPLRIAQRAIYPRSAVETLTDEQRKKHTESLSDDRIRVRQATRERVSIARINLAAPWRLKGPFDAIFCRNVMIYFDEESRERLVKRFASLLRPGGHLAIGLTESITGRSDQLESVAPGMYQKRSGAR